MNSQRKKQQVVGSFDLKHDISEKKGQKNPLGQGHFKVNLSTNFNLQNRIQ